MDRQAWTFLTKIFTFCLILGLWSTPAQAQIASIAGDVNGDGTVNVLDVQGVIRQALGLDATTPAGDVNRDNAVNVLDVQTDILIALGNPVLIELSPDNGAAGAIVTLEGSNFSATLGSNTVNFNGATAVINQFIVFNNVNVGLEVVVPVGAMTGNVSFTVNNVTSNSKNFTVMGGPPPAGDWVDLNSPTLLMPNGAFAADTLNDEIYLVGGLDANNAAVNAIVKYTPDTGVLAAEPVSLPVTNATADPGAVFVNGKLYIFGGADIANLALFATGFVYDPAQGTLDPIADMPEGRAAFATAAIGTDIYVFGGARVDFSNIFMPAARPTDTIFRYDTVGNTWTVLSTTLPGVSQWATAQTVGSDIYVIGGGDFVLSVDIFTQISTQTTNSNSNMNLKFTPTSPISGTLTAMANLPSATKQLASGVINGKIYVAGGDRTTGAHSAMIPWTNISADTFEYDPVTNMWTTRDMFETNISGMGALGGRTLSGGAAATGKFYLMGGFTQPLAANPALQGLVDVIAEFTP